MRQVCAHWKPGIQLVEVESGAPSSFLFLFFPLLQEEQTWRKLRETLLSCSSSLRSLEREHGMRDFTPKLRTDSAGCTPAAV